MAIFDAFNGASGDMIVSSLYGVSIYKEDLEEVVNKLNLELSFKVKRVKKNEISANLIDVSGKINERTFEEVVNIIKYSEFDEIVKNNSIKIFEKLAIAEGTVHGIDYRKAKFHEVGSDDAIFDIVSAVIGILRLKEEGHRIYTSVIRTGKGFVKFSHGKYPIPAPATLEILKNSKIEVLIEGEGELLTPTASAILSHFSEGTFKGALYIENINYGAGKRNTEIPNVLRLLIGRCQERDEIALIETNVDDLNPEYLAYATEKLGEVAYDVSIIPAYFKKGRVGSLVRVITTLSKAEEVAKEVMKHTGSLGVRIIPVYHRVKSYREIKNLKINVKGKDYNVKIKISEYGVKPEFEDLKRIANETDLSIKEISEIVMREVKWNF